MIRKFFISVFLLVLVGLVEAKAQLLKNPFSALNSSSDEQNPILSPDGQTLYFTRGNHPANVGGERDPGDIWYSTLQADQSWSAPVHARKINSYGWNGVLGFSADGNEVLLHNHYATGSLLKTQGIAVATKTGSGWSEPVNISIPYFKNLSGYQSGALTDDGQVMVLSLESYGTKGAEDLYMLFNENGKWSEPKNLGDRINTKYQEFTPTFSGDSLLFFASNGHDGEGSSDIFMCKRLDESWLNWSAPENVAAVNTEGRELAYRQYDGFAVYTSTLNSDGYGDIKLFQSSPDSTIFKKQTPPDSLSIVAIDENQIPDNQIVLYGTVKDEDTGNVVRGNVKVSSEGRTKRINLKDDEELFIINLKSPGNYTVHVDAPGYIPQQKNVELASAEAKKLEMDFVLKPISVGARVNLENVLFKQSKAEIIESSFEELDLVVSLMNQNPSMKIKLEGHTDNRGVAKHNQRLSKKRAEAVEDYLVSKGISSRRVSGKGYGGDRPIADNDDPELRKLNRRVEFVIVKE